MEPTKQYPSARKRIHKEKTLFLEYLKKTPLIEIVCQKVGISRSTIYRWKKEDKAFGKAFTEAIYLGTDVTNDAVESALLNGVQKGNPALIKFYLQHRHPAYSTTAADYRARLEAELGMAGTQAMTPEQKMKLDMMLADVTELQNRHKGDGLVIHDPQPEIPTTSLEEPTAS